MRLRKKILLPQLILIADRTAAWVLETAGPYWVAEQVKDVRAISNRLSIGSNFDLAHPDVIRYAIDRGWCTSKADFHFARCYSDRLYTKFSGSAQRFATCSTQLGDAKGKITVQTMMKILRSHHPQHTKPFQQASLKSVCMHGGFLIGDHATGSYVASLNNDLDTYWLTGSSTPCISLFKPYWFTDSQIIHSPAEEGKALDFWLLRERLHRLVLENKIPDLDEYLQKAAYLEQGWLARISSTGKTPPQSVLNEIMEKAWKEEKRLVEEVVRVNKNNKGKLKGGIIFRQYWRRQNVKLGDTNGES